MNLNRNQYSSRFDCITKSDNGLCTDHPSPLALSNDTAQVRVSRPILCQLWSLANSVVCSSNSNAVCSAIMKPHRPQNRKTCLYTNVSLETSISLLTDSLHYLYDGALESHRAPSNWSDSTNVNRVFHKEQMSESLNTSFHVLSKFGAVVMGSHTHIHTHIHFSLRAGISRLLIGNNLSWL